MAVAKSSSPVRKGKVSSGNDSQFDLCVIGGAGHIGLPLAIVFASRKKRVLIYDINKDVMDKIMNGEMPFMERGAEPLLKQVLSEGRLQTTSNPADIAGIPSLLIIIGTPIDEFFNPSMKGLTQCIDQISSYLSDDQLIVLRSTVYPGTTEWLNNYLASKGKHPKLAFCPERIVQGNAIEELQELPQIISGVTPESQKRAAELFHGIGADAVFIEPLEAEFAKLFCNAYRYIQFAAANQFYMMANSAGLDYYKILNGMKQNYPRMRDFPGAGFSAGPCLFKDTMQLTAFYDNEFSLGYTAMLVNEGLPLYVIQQLSRHYKISELKVGLLGMAFKPNIDDARSSLSYKLKKALSFRAKEVLTTDPYVVDSALKPLAEVIAQSDLLILCVPHKNYQGLDVQNKPVVDIWNFFGKGGRIGPDAMHIKNSEAAPASIPVTVK